MRPSRRAAGPDKATFRLYLVRHGQSAWQVAPDDDWDTHLTETGHQQARRLARWLALEQVGDGERAARIRSLFTSPSHRARETAEVVARHVGLTVSQLPELREASFHVAEHLPRSSSPFVTPSRETVSSQYEAFKRQAHSALCHLAEEALLREGPVMAIAHGGLIKTLLRIVCGSDMLSFRLYNASLNVIEWRDGRWHLVHVNMWDHLPPGLRTS